MAGGYNDNYSHNSHEGESKGMKSKYNSNYKNVRYPEIEKADNGYIVEWSEKVESKGMEHSEYVKKRQLFSTEEVDDAWEKFKELKMYVIEMGKDNMMY